MHQSKLCGVLEELGYTEVQGVISSGNVIFESPRTDVTAMEAEMEAAWPKKLGFTSTTLIRSQQQLEEVARNHPYEDMTHKPETYLLVTFFKRPTKVPFTLPYQPEGKPYKLLAATTNHLFTITDNTAAKTTDLMVWLEKQFTKDISSRTLLTVSRILKKMQN
jgi:uncharacterized protein (DUF1697 family)